MSRLIGKAGGTLQQNLSDRAQSVKTLIRTEVGLIKDAVNDVVERIDLDENVRPSLSNRGIGGTLPGTVIAVVAGTWDNGVDFVQENAKITRRWVTRR